MISWVHFGDLHVSQEDGWHSLRDFSALVDDANRHLQGRVDFAYLPGDNANHGSPEQYRRIAEVIGRLRLPCHAIPGDHDFEPGNLEAFRSVLGAPTLPAVFVHKGRRCLLLDIVSAGDGGPDFRLGTAQTAWLEDQLAASDADAERPIVLMHAFPGDLTEGSSELARLFARHEVACVDTGHTHYNELLNDGAVIYGATRSTGQIEEGPVGFSLHSVDGSAVAWRFKALTDAWPLVLITSPCDRRLITDPRRSDQVPATAFAVRAKVFGGDVAEVWLTVDDAAPVRMQAVAEEASLWTAPVLATRDGEHRIGVAAHGRDGSVRSDHITVEVRRAPTRGRSPLSAHAGEDVHSIGAWPEHGIVGGQLGPNRNGKKW